LSRTLRYSIMLTMNIRGDFMAMTHEERLARQRFCRAANNNAATKKYERTKPGKLMRIYRNMKSRVCGVQHLKAHLYEGKYLMPKEEFYQWASSCYAFHQLYAAWVESGYDRKLAPSVDRVDSTRGYEIDNLEWVTHSENSRRGGLSQSRKKAH
jgi:hypothetical protein